MYLLLVVVIVTPVPARTEGVKKIPQNPEPGRGLPGN
jgi:hypothetical protein